MATGDIHTVPHDGSWANRAEGTGPVSNTFATKADAQASRREMAIAGKGEHLIHNLDGTISERSTCTGHDPSSSPG